MSRRTVKTSIFWSITLSLLFSSAAIAKSPPVVFKIGTFDSRAVALAYWRSDEGNKQINSLRKEFEKAKAANDEKRVKELEVKGPGLQIRLHQQVFSTGSVTDVIKKVEAKLPAIAKEAGVQMIVPKWHIAFKGAYVECVDVTPQLVKLFNPSEQILKMIEEMKAKAPVPIEELSMDPRH